MQVLLIILAAVVLLPAPEGGFPARLEPLASIGLVLGGMVTLLLVAALNARLLQDRLAGDRPLRQFERAARSLRFVQWAAVGIVAAIPDGHDDLKHALSAALESHTNEWVEVNDI